jgi:hypothetical protein
MRMSSLRDLTESMARIHGRRKAMLYITRGLDVDVFEALDFTGGVRSMAFDDLHRAMAAATRGNVAIYPIDPAGLTIGGGNTGESARSGGRAGRRRPRICVRWPWPRVASPSSVPTASSRPSIASSARTARTMWSALRRRTSGATDGSGPSRCA